MGGALPPSESVAIGTREVARRLRAEARGPSSSRAARADGVEVEHQDGGVEYRLVPAELDWRAMKAATPVALARDGTPAVLRRAVLPPGYFRAVTRELPGCGPDVVTVHNFSQLLPVLRRRAPRRDG